MGGDIYRYDWISCTCFFRWSQTVGIGTSSWYRRKSGRICIRFRGRRTRATCGDGAWYRQIFCCFPTKDTGSRRTSGSCHCRSRWMCQNKWTVRRLCGNGAPQRIAWWRKPDRFHWLPHLFRWIAKGSQREAGRLLCVAGRNPSSQSGSAPNKSGRHKRNHVFYPDAVLLPHRCGFSRYRGIYGRAKTEILCRFYRDACGKIRPFLWKLVPA